MEDTRKDKDIVIYPPSLPRGTSTFEYTSCRISDNRRAHLESQADKLVKWLEGELNKTSTKNNPEGKKTPDETANTKTEENNLSKKRIRSVTFDGDDVVTTDRSRDETIHEMGASLYEQMRVFNSAVNNGNMESSVAQKNMQEIEPLKLKKYAERVTNTGSLQPLTKRPYRAEGQRNYVDLTKDSDDKKLIG